LLRSVDEGYMDARRTACEIKLAKHFRKLELQLELGCLWVRFCFNHAMESQIHSIFVGSIEPARHAECSNP